MIQDIKITFLGTADAIPTARRNHTAILLSYANENILVDCGEGTQRQFRLAGLNPLKLTRILITHWHGDHVLGLPGLFQTLAFQGYNKTLHLFGPKGTKKYVDEVLNTFVFAGKLDVKIEEVSNKKFFETKDFYLEAKSMSHGCPCNAYCFVKKGSLRIDKAKLKKAKITPGPILQEIKQGKDIIFNGKKFKAKDLTYKADEKKICFVLDTKLNPDVVDFAKNSDLLISEAGFSSELEEKANEYKHLTSKQAAEIAKKAKVKKLVLTHISQRYEKNLGKILNEAKKYFKNSFLVKDLDVVKI
ncbi:MAG: ribonuclease Z [Nanoarchaeota archaeon]|nr:ribonuclease Z [Nanoarchaeota archaeon]